MTSCTVATATVCYCSAANEPAVWFARYDPYIGTRF